MPYDSEGNWVSGPVTPSEQEGVLQKGTKLGQEVAEAAGTAYKDIAKPAQVDTTGLGYDAAATSAGIAENVTVPTGTESITAGKSTVAGQLESLLAEESPYIQQARAAGEEQAASRGMLNTSMAARSAERAAIESAMPIAQQDAQTYATAEGMEQKAQTDIATIQAEAITSGEIVKQKAAISQSEKNIQNAFNAAMQGATESNKVLLQDLQNQHSAGMQELQGAQTLAMQNAEYDALTLETLREQNNEVMQNYQITVENLMSDPEFTELGEEAMNNALVQMQNLAKNTIMFNGASAGLNLTSYVDAFLGDINYV